MPFTSGVRGTQVETDGLAGHLRVAHAAMAVLLAGGVVCISPSRIAAATSHSPAGPSETAVTTQQPVSRMSADLSRGQSSPRFTLEKPSGTRAITSILPPMPVAGRTGVVDQGSAPVAAPAAALGAAPAGTPGRTSPVEAPRVAAEPATKSDGTWSLDLYDPKAERWQNPDKTACTAASTISMLNTIAHSGASEGMTWKPTTSYSAQETILAFERSHMTMDAADPGTDPHGWRNALNFYGWGSVNAGVYADQSFKTLEGATKAAVSALATTGKPVGVLAHYGKHAEFITGYKVSGEDPTTGSTQFTVLGIALTDPWQAYNRRDAYISYSRWSGGSQTVRFTPYMQVDSRRRDAIDRKVGKNEWLGKYVIVAPVK